MLTLPADVARCRGRVWSDSTNSFLADECQACERWIAHWCHAASDGPVAHQEPPTARDCPLRMPMKDGSS